MDSIQASFPKRAQTDNAVELNGVAYAQPMSDAQMIAAFGETFFNENDPNGTPQLCANKVLDMPMVITYRDVNGDYEVGAQPFIPVSIIGPNPTVIYRPRPSK